ncbi:MAG: hypothetical protein ACOYIB_06510 [Desulfosporosinus sp.]|jgi:hypothetical protein
MIKKYSTDYWKMILLGLSVAYLLGLSAVVDRLNLGLVFIIWLGAMLPVMLLYRSWSVLLEMSMLPFLWLIAVPFEFCLGPTWYLLLVSTITISISHRIDSRIATTGSVLFSLILGLLLTYNRQIGIVGFVLSVTILFWLAFYGLKTIRGKAIYKPPKNIDLILCSFSGNTGHYANEFIESARKSGSAVIVHRVHYYQAFKPVLNGDSLVRGC